MKRGFFYIESDFLRVTWLRGFLPALFSVLEFFHLFHRRFLVVLASAVLFHDSVSITEALEFLEGAFDRETISNIDADFVSGISLLVGQWNLSLVGVKSFSVK